MIVLGIDPGNEESAFVMYDAGLARLLAFGDWPNAKLLAAIHGMAGQVHALAIEYPQPRGQPMYTQLVDTIFWIGRFVERAGREWHPVNRMHVKIHLCGTPRGKDSNVRAALVSRWSVGAPGLGGSGPVGTKAKPGPLYGVSGDVWAALAVAVTFAEVNAAPQENQSLAFLD